MDFIKKSSICFLLFFIFFQYTAKNTAFSQPKLVCGTASITPSTPVQSFNATFLFPVSNTGNEKYSGTLKLMWRNDTEGYILQSYNGEILPNTTYTFTHSSLPLVSNPGTWQLRIEDNFGNIICSKTVQVVRPKSIIVLTGNLDFGPVTINMASSRYLYINNNGDKPFTVHSLSLPEGFVSNGYIGEIAPKSYKNISIMFLPTKSISYGGLITVNSDAQEGVNSIKCTGIGSSVPTKILSLNGEMNFGSVQLNQILTSTLNIYNSGIASLNIYSISLPQGFTSDWQSGVISAGGKKSVNITFKPTNPIYYSGVITINSDLTHGDKTINCSGTGIGITNRIISITGDLKFGNIEINQSINRTLTVHNTGNSILTVNSITLPKDFKVNWVGGQIAPGATQTLIVTFKPTSSGAFSGNITFDSDKTDGINTISYSGISIVKTRQLRIIGDRHTSFHLSDIRKLSFNSGQLFVYKINDSPQIFTLKSTRLMDFESNSIATQNSNNIVSDKKPSVFPNPFTNEVIIRFSHPVVENVTFYITNIEGKTIYTDILNGGKSEYKFDFSSFSDGIYLFRFLNKADINVLKLIKK